MNLGVARLGPQFDATKIDILRQTPSRLILDPDRHLSQTAPEQPERLLLRETAPKRRRHRPTWTRPIMDELSSPAFPQSPFFSSAFDKVVDSKVGSMHRWQTASGVPLAGELSSPHPAGRAVNQPNLQARNLVLCLDGTNSSFNSLKAR